MSSSLRAVLALVSALAVTPALAQPNYVLQIADNDVDCITPFKLKQNRYVSQGQRFSIVRYGSQVDLIIPLCFRFAFEPLREVGDHVEAGIDPIVKVTAKPIA